jgi:uncharacterized protein (DUF3820 family)
MTDLILKFGKYRDQSIIDVAHKDPGYARWLHAQKILITGSPIEQWLDDNHTTTDVFEMPWGKYKGKTLAQITSCDPQYIEWLRKSDLVAKQKHIADAIDNFRNKPE